MTLTEIYQELEPLVLRLNATPEELAEEIEFEESAKAALEARVAEIEARLVVYGMPEAQAKEQLAALVTALSAYAGSVTPPVEDPVSPPPPPPPPVEDPVSPPPPPPPPEPEPVVAIVREVPLFDGAFRNGGALGGNTVTGLFDNKPVLVLTPGQWSTGAIHWNSQGTPRFVKVDVYVPANITEGTLALRHTAGWNTINLGESNKDKWYVDGNPGVNFPQFPRDKWVEVAVNLEAFNINEFKAFSYSADRRTDKLPVYFANVGFDTFLASTPVVLPPPPPPPPPTPPAVDPTAIVLDTFQTTPVQRWNYNQVYHPIEGPQPGKMAAGWAFTFDNIVPNAQGALIHRMTNFGASGIKWEAEKKLRKTQGHYIVEATLPPLRNGVVAAPLWLYSEGASEPYHEYDFELMNGRIEYNLHNGNGGFNMKKVEKDLSGHRVRFEIIRRPGVVTMRVTSLTDGFTDSLVITPALVADWATRSGAPANLRYPPDNVAMFPLTEYWVSQWPSWSGTWQTIPVGQSLDMIVHGYKFLP